MIPVPEDNMREGWMLRVNDGLRGSVKDNDDVFK